MTCLGTHMTKAPAENGSNMPATMAMTRNGTYKVFSRPFIMGIVLIVVFIIYWAQSKETPHPRAPSFTGKHLEYEGPIKMHCSSANQNAALRIKHHDPSRIISMKNVFFYQQSRETPHPKVPSFTGKHLEYEGPIKKMDKILDGIKVRFYVQEDLPANKNKAIIHIHGGGWIGGSIESNDDICQNLAKEVGTVVISIEYRLAPKYPYPAAMLDCYKAVTYILSHASQHGIDPHRIALVGFSAGGNLAAAVTLRLRDFKFEPRPKLQVLLNACLQAIDFNTPSYQKNGEGRGLTKRTMASMWAKYALGKSLHATTLLANQHTSPDVKSWTSKRRLNHAIILKDHPLHDEYTKQRIDFGDIKLWKRIESIFTDPYFAPLMAEDVSNLPETMIFTTKGDILRDEGIWYARYLRLSNVEVTHRNFEGFHASVLENFGVMQRALFALIRQKL